MKPIGFSEFAEFAELSQLGFTWFYSANSEKPIGTELTELGELGTERCLWVSVKYCTTKTKYYSPTICLSNSLTQNSEISSQTMNDMTRSSSKPSELYEVANNYQ